MTEAERFGLRLYRLMQQHGIETQSELARRCKMSRSQVCKYMAGQGTPSYAVLRRLQKAIGCSFDELMGDE